MILLDTSILSLAFRRPAAQVEAPEVQVLSQLIREDQPLAIPGIVLQELLSGVRAPAQFLNLQRLLEGFPVLLAGKAHHVEGARIANACRQQGIAATAIDCLIAATAVLEKARLFTLDQDFQRMSLCTDLQLFRRSPK